MADPTPHIDHDPAIAAQLAARYERMRRVTGPEPADLAEVARWVDGEASPEAARAIEARVAGDAELAEAIARMHQVEQVASLAAARAKRDAARTRGLWIGGGVLLAAAAAVLVVVAGQGANPGLEVAHGALGAGPAGSRPSVTIVAGRVEARGATLLVHLAPGRAEVMREGATAAHEACGFVLAIAGTAQGERAIQVLEGALTETCELPPLEVIQSRIPGATALTLTRL